MPTQNVSSLGGYNKAVSANAIKDGSTVVKAGGTYSALSGSTTSIATPSEFMNYNVSMSNSGVAAWAEVAFATATTSVGAPDHTRKLVETTPASPIWDLDNGQSYKTTDRDLNKVGKHQLIDGRWVWNTSGSTVVGLASTGYSAVASAGGATVDTDRIGRGTSQDYNYRIGKTNAEGTLTPRFQ